MGNTLASNSNCKPLPGLHLQFSLSLSLSLALHSISTFPILSFPVLSLCRSTDLIKQQKPQWSAVSQFTGINNSWTGVTEITRPPSSGARFWGGAGEADLEERDRMGWAGSGWAGLGPLGTEAALLSEALMEPIYLVLQLSSRPIPLEACHCVLCLEHHWLCQRPS